MKICKTIVLGMIHVKSQLTVFGDLELWNFQLDLKLSASRARTGLKFFCIGFYLFVCLW